MAHTHGGEVVPSSIREYGRARLSRVDTHVGLLKELTPDSVVWMSHGDTIAQVPEAFEVIASTPTVAVAAFQSARPGNLRYPVSSRSDALGRGKNGAA